MVNGAVYVDTNTVEPVLFNPWSANVPVIGTDGMQFSSTMDETYSPTVFLGSLSRPLSFNFTGTDSSSYNGLTLYNFGLESTQLNNATETPTNAVYDIWVTGTTNLTSTLKVPAFASKPLFYGVNSPTVASSIPKMLDANGNAISGSADNESVFSVEYLSGLTLKSTTNLQYNYNLKNDYLINLAGNTGAFGQFMPLVWIQRSADLSQSTVNDLLGTIVTANKDKWIVFGICLGVGVVSLAVGAFLMIKAKMMAAEAGNGGAGGQLPRNSEQEPLNAVERDSTKVGPAIRINLSEKVAGDRDTEAEDNGYEVRVDA